MADRQESEGTPGHLRAAVIGVGAAQLYVWGVLYYPFSVTGKLIAADVGVSLEAAFFGFSILLVMGALAAPFAGRAIDRFGGRIVLTLGCFAGAASLAFAAYADNPFLFYASCVALGLATAVTLYDAAFASIVQVAGAHSRRAITYVTFLGGFASTLFWPITAWLCDRVGWRWTYLIFAGGMVLIWAPVYAFVLRKPVVEESPGEAPQDAPPPPAHETPLQGRTRRTAFIIFATAVAFHQFVIAGLLIHMIEAMNRAGLAPAEAIMVGMAFGPGQVLGRVGEMVWGSRFPAVTTGRVAMAALPLAMLFLVSGSMNFPLALLFSAVCGMSNASAACTMILCAMPLLASAFKTCSAMAIAPTGSLPTAICALAICGAEPALLKTFLKKPPPFAAALPCCALRNALRTSNTSGARVSTWAKRSMA